LGYAAEKSNIELGIYGTGAHSDYGLITLLATDGVPGLQVQNYHILFESTLFLKDSRIYGYSMTNSFDDIVKNIELKLLYQ